MSAADLSVTAATSSDSRCEAIDLGGVTYDPAARVLRIGEETQTLEPRLGDLLMRLAQAPGPVSRDALLDDIWGCQGSDEALTQAISKLRRALGDTVRPYRLIQTVPKEGYRLAAAPVVARAVDIAAVRPVQSTVGGIRQFIAPRREFLKGVAAGVGLSIIAAAIFVLLSPPMKVEREIICPEGADPAACAALAD